MNQNELLKRVNQTLGEDYSHRTLLVTVEDLLNHVDLLQEENGLMAEKHAEKDAVIEQLIDELTEAKRNSRFHKFMEMAEENLKLAEENARLKGVIPV